MFRYAAAATLGTLLVLHTRTFPIEQLLWACHVATAVIAVGLVTGRPWVIAIGTVFHAGQGIPAYSLELLAGGAIIWTSVLLHILPVTFGGLALWGTPLPRNIILPAWLLTPITMIAAYFLADPALNVMLVHEPFPMMAPVMPNRAALWLGNIALSLGFISGGWLVLRWLWRRW
jgi:hypothetical protein